MFLRQGSLNPSLPVLALSFATPASSIPGGLPKKYLQIEQGMHCTSGCNVHFLSRTTEGERGGKEGGTGQNEAEPCALLFSPTLLPDVLVADFEARPMAGRPNQWRFTAEQNDLQELSRAPSTEVLPLVHKVSTLEPQLLRSLHQLCRPPPPR